MAWLSVPFPEWVPLSALSLPILAGGFLLHLRRLAVLLVVSAGAVGAVLLDERIGMNGVRPGSVVVIAASALIALAVARSRAALGLQGLRGESMLVDLRDRLRAQGEMPALPAGWEAEVVTRSAGGSSFSGDFLVAERSRDGRSLEVAIVDVSGKGVDAGTRALLLSGAFGGLLGSLPRQEFLPAANAYLLRQEWDEGFATAAHLAIDLHTGEYEVHSAGHPPALQFLAGSGRWKVVDARGPLLGVVPDAEYEPASGFLLRGDALLLYTDGLIEIPGRDLSVGIDKLLGEAERLVPQGFRRGARRLLDAMASGAADDRAVAVIWRT